MKSRLLASIFLMLYLSTAEASFIDQKNGTVLDTQTSLVWLQTWNSGQMTQYGAATWARNITIADSVGWLLPSAGQYVTLWADASATDYASLRQNAGIDPCGRPNDNCSFWTTSSRPGQDVALGGDAYYFFAQSQGYGLNWENPAYLKQATAVRAATYAELNPVPVPATAWLMLSGLGAMGAASRRRKTRAAQS